MTATPTETTKTPYLQIQGLVKKYGDNYAVDSVDLNIERHEIFALLGSSGSGKSTLLRMLAGMERPSQGKILLDGLDVTYQAPYERPINMMFQSYALFPHMSVEQNIAFGLKQDKMAKGEIDARVEDMLKLVQMTKYAKRKPHQLSGGQQQRIALARSLAKRPKLLLLDEPLGALDKKLRQQTQLELVNMLEQVGVTCIMVTHDQEEAMTMATRVAIMSDGKLRQVGTPREIYDYPNSRFTAEFIGESNIIAGEVIEDAADYCLIVKLAAEVADLSEAMRAIMLSGTEQILGRLADVVARGQADGSIANPAPAAELAQWLYEAWLGASLLAKLRRDDSAFRAVLQRSCEWLQLS